MAKPKGGKRKERIEISGGINFLFSFSRKTVIRIAVILSLLVTSLLGISNSAAGHALVDGIVRAMYPLSHREEAPSTKPNAQAPGTTPPGVSHPGSRGPEHGRGSRAGKGVSCHCPKGHGLRR